MDQPMKQLQDAADLLVMLEHLVDSVSPSELRGAADDRRGNSPADPRVPWAGIRLTLRQARELVVSAHRSRDGQRPRERANDPVPNGQARRPERSDHHAQQHAQQGGQYAPEGRNTQQGRNTHQGGQPMSLADRVQPAPTGGRIREIPPDRGSPDRSVSDGNGSRGGGRNREQFSVEGSDH